LVHVALEQYALKQPKQIARERSKEWVHHARQVLVEL
jgi:hypothetical protein